MFRSIVSLIGLLLLPLWAAALPPVATPAVLSNTLPEDFGVAIGDLTGIFMDPDGDPMTYSIQSSTVPNVMPTTIDSVTGLVTFTSLPNMLGSQTWVFLATDINGETATFTFTATYIPINDVPVVAGPIPTLIANEDVGGASVSLAGVFNDVDIATNGDVLTLSVVGHSGSPIATATMSGSSLNITLVPDQNGAGSVTVRATDTAGAFVDANVPVKINPVNDDPYVVTPIADVTVAEDSAAIIIDVGPAFDDVDIGTNGDTLTYSLISVSNGALFDSVTFTGSQLTLTPALNQNGNATVTVAARDTFGATAQDSFVVTINPVNDAPVVAGPVPTLVVDEDAAGGSVSLAGVFDDVDIATNGDTLTLSVTGFSGTAIATATMSGNSLNITLVPDQNGAGSVTVRAVDSDGAFVDVNVPVTVNPVNDDPYVVAPIPDIATAEDSPPFAIDMAAYFDDVDGDTLTYSVTSVSNPTLFDSAVFSGSTLTMTLALNQNGSASITVEADDGAGGTVTDTFQVNVAPTNDAPVVVGAIPALTTDEDTAGSVSLAGVFDDIDIVDGDSLTLSVSAFAGGSIDTASMAGNTLNITLVPDQNGLATVTVRATDTGGAFVDANVPVKVNPVNDDPFVAQPIPDVNAQEDDPPIDVDVSLTFDDVDIATNGDVLTYNVTSVSNGSLFDSVVLSGTIVTLSLAFDQNGTSTITVEATDSAGATVSDTFQVSVAPVNDIPVANDDVVAVPMNEDSGVINISVLDNDYLAEEPTTIKSAGVDGNSESAPTTVIDPFGDSVTAPNGVVTIIGNVIEYQPKANFYGTDTFTYTIEDAEGDVSAPATVTVTVLQVNDPPVGVQQRTFSMFENGLLTVDAVDGLFQGAYDVDGALLDAMGNPLGWTPNAVLTSLPAVGSLTFNGATGEFEYSPPINYTGTVTFNYRLFDGVDLSDTPEYEVRVVVNAVPAPPLPPPPGQVAIFDNASQVPLEQASSVPPNVLVVMDNSGSMDFHTVVADDLDGGFPISNANAVNNPKKVVVESFVYLWDLSINTYPPSSSFGGIVPTEDALAADSDTDGNDYGVWRARNHQYNTLYYNPEVHYTPWVGQDDLNVEFGDADPSAIRLDPVDPSNTFDMLAPHNYTSSNVPVWHNRSGTTNVSVTGMYIPHYYSTAATPPLAWDDSHTLVEIKSNTGPLPGKKFPGGPNRDDCAINDNDPTACTYAEEIQNFANWFQYYRNREYVAKAGMGKVIAEVQDMRVGYDTISNVTSIDIAPMNDLHMEGAKKALLDNIYAVDSFGGTPLRQALGRAGATFACQRAGFCPALPAPDGTCQQNFALLFSDGYWNGGTGVSTDDDGDDDTSFDGGRYADSEKATLADVAMHYYEHDMFPLVDNQVPVSQRDVDYRVTGSFSDDVMHQHMKTYAIAFGVYGTIAPSTVPANPVTPFGWPDPFAGPLEKIDDMLHTAYNGRGTFINANNAQELQTAFEKAFLEFSQAASSSSAAAFNSTSLRDGTLLYRGFYDLRDNTGELTATEVNTDGTLAASPTWVASAELDGLLPNNRIMVTSHSTSGDGIPFRHASLSADQQITLTAADVAFLRGDRSSEMPTGSQRERPLTNGLLGDIVNSSPVFVGEPRAINRDQAPYPTASLYSSFAAAHVNRDPVVYVGANDGMLHGFDAATGVERVAYVPNKIIDNSQRYANTLDDFASPFYIHNYYVDLTPRFNDVYMRSSRVAVSKSWNTVVLGGLGAGGKGYFALNVTDPATQFSSEANAAASVLWEFTDEDDTYPLDVNGNPIGGAVNAITDSFGAPVKDMGLALSAPTVAMSNAVDGNGDKEWVAVFGNGPNSTAGIATLFVLNMDGGLNGSWGDAGDFIKLTTGVGVPIPPAQRAGYPNGLGSVTGIDRDLNGTLDWVYGGDQLGNLYRFDLTDPNPSNWTVTRLFTATYNDGTTDLLQPIMSRPLVIRHPTEDGFLIIFGTGSHFSRADAGNEEIQSIYAIWDRGEVSPATALANSKGLRLVEQTITNVVDDSVSPAQTRRVMSRNIVNYEPESGVPGTYGWYVDLDMERAATTTSGAANPDTGGNAPPDPQYPGEKAVRRMVFRDGTIITTTVLPSTGETSCFGNRPGSILLLDAETGGDAVEPIIDFNGDGNINDDDLVETGGSAYSAGLLFNEGDLDGQLVDLSTLGGQGDLDFLFISGGNDTESFLLDDINDSRTGRLSWRELDDAN